MNWMPIKHTLFVNRTKAGTFSCQLRPSNFRDKNGYQAEGEGATYEEAIEQVENKVKAIKIIREAA